jgi:hypothetical protein
LAPYREQETAGRESGQSEDGRDGGQM